MNSDDPYSDDPPEDSSAKTTVGSELRYDEYNQWEQRQATNLTMPPPSPGQRVLSPDHMATMIPPNDTQLPVGTFEIAGEVGATPFVSRSRVYSFVQDQAGNPIELGSGRFAKAFLGEERWVESKTAYRRHVAIKAMQCGVSTEDQMRFQMEKEILERVQGHPNIVEVIASGEADNPNFIPPQLRDRVENVGMWSAVNSSSARLAVLRLPSRKSSSQRIDSISR